MLRHNDFAGAPRFVLPLLGCKRCSLNGIRTESRRWGPASPTQRLQRAAGNCTPERVRGYQLLRYSAYRGTRVVPQPQSDPHPAFGARAAENARQAARPIKRTAAATTNATTSVCPFKGITRQSPAPCRRRTPATRRRRRGPACTQTGAPPTANRCGRRRLRAP